MTDIPIHRSRNEKKRNVHHQQHSQPERDLYNPNRNSSTHGLDKPGNTHTSTNNSTSSARNSSPDYFNNKTKHKNGNGYQYQPQPLAFQTASEKFRGQHLRIDTQNIGGHYPTCQARQELYLDTCSTNLAVMSGSSLYRCSEPEMTRYQTGFVEGPSSEHEKAQCYYI